MSGSATSGKRALLVGLAPAAVVAVAVVAAVLVSGPGLYTNPDPGRISSKPYSSPTPAASSPLAADQAEITAVMEQYIRAQNDGDVTSFRATLCQGTLSSASAFEDRPPLTEQRGHIDSVTDVRVAGNSATAVISASFEGQPELGSKSTQLLFVNENGWKLCMSS